MARSRFLSCKPAPRGCCMAGKAHNIVPKALLVLLHTAVLLSTCRSSAAAGNSTAAGPGTAPVNGPPKPVIPSPSPAATKKAAPSLPLPAKWNGTGAGAIVRGTQSNASAAAVSSFVPGRCGQTPTKWGYQCSMQSPQGIDVYWSVDVPPPFNPCTGVPAATANTTGLIHFLAEAWLPRGRLELSFADEPGVLYPAFTVAGSANATTTAAGVSMGRVLPYHKINVRDEALGFMSGITGHAVRVKSGNVTSRADGDQTLLLCFTRRVVDNSLPVGKDLRPGMWLGWATYAAEDVDPTDSIEAPLASGTAAVNPWTGIVFRTTSIREPIVKAHGILMIAAFGALLPLAALLNRHEWVFGMGQDTSRSWAWYFVRIITQVVALATALAGVVMVLVVFGNRNPGSSLWPWHQALGLVALGMALMQLPLWALTRRASREVRALSNTINFLGVCVGIANLFVGVMLVHRTMFDPLQDWATPAAVVGGFTITLALALEIWRAFRGHDDEWDLIYKDHDIEGYKTPLGVPPHLAPIKTRVGQPPQVRRKSSNGRESVVTTPYLSCSGDLQRRSTTGSGAGSARVASLV